MVSRTNSKNRNVAVHPDEPLSSTTRPNSSHKSVVSSTNHDQLSGGESSHGEFPGQSEKYSSKGDFYEDFENQKKKRKFRRKVKQLSWLTCFCPLICLRVSLKFPLFCKLLCLVQAPTIAMIVLSIVFIAQLGSQVDAQERSRQVISTAQQISELTTLLEEERSSSISFISTVGADLQVKLMFEKSANNVDIHIPPVRSIIYDIRESLSPTQVVDRETLRNALANLDNLPSFRETLIKENIVEARRLSIDYYSDTIRFVNNLIPIYSRQIGAGSSTNQITGYTAFLAIMERTKLLRALLTPVFDDGGWLDPDMQEYILFTQRLGARTGFIFTFKGIATEQQQQLFHKIELSPESIHAERMIQVALQNPKSLQLNVSAAEFFNNITSVIESYDEVDAAFIDSLYSEQNKNQTTAITNLVIVICVMVSLTILCFVALFCCSYLIYSPWSKMLKKSRAAISMAESVAGSIATLDLSTRAIRRLKRKNDSELGILELSMKKIILNFEIFREYLPPSLIALVKETAAASKTSKKMNSKIVTGANDLKLETQSAQLTNPSTKQSKGGRTTKSKGLLSLNFRRGMVSRDVTMVVCDIENYHKHMTQSDTVGLLRMHSDLLFEFSNLVTSNRGVLLNFTGDRFAAVFNGINNCPNHSIKAIQTATRFQQVIQGKLIGEWRSQRLTPIQCNVSVTSSSSCSIGSVGAHGIMKTLTVCGQSVTKAYHMVKLAKIYRLLSNDSRVVIDQSTFEAVKFQYQVFPIDVVYYLDTSSEKTMCEIVYRVISEQAPSSSQNEWMYEISSHLDETSEKPLFQRYIEAFQSIVKYNDTKNHEILIELSEFVTKEKNRNDDDLVSNEIGMELISGLKPILKRMEQYLEDARISSTRLIGTRLGIL